MQTGDVLTGGAGTDTVIANFNTASTIKPTLSGIENIQLTSTGAALTLDLGSATGVSKVTSSATTGNLELRNATISEIAIADQTTASKYVNVALASGALSGASDSLTISVMGATATGTTIALSRADSSGTGNLESVTLFSTGVANQLDTITTTGVGATTVNITGDSALTITSALSAAVTAVNASAMTGAVTAALSTTGTTFTGGTGVDTVTVQVANDSITLGDGADIVIASNAGFITSGDTINGGGGSDTLNVSVASGSMADTAFTNISSIETLDLSSANMAGTVTLGAKALAASIGSIKVAA